MTGTTRTPARARKRLGASAQRILIRDAAVLVFAERGIEAASVEDVLERAQVSRQTFYRCYRSKTDLLEAVQEMVTERLRALAGEMRDDSLPPDQALRHHVKLLFDHAARSGPIVCELEREAMRPDSPFHAHRLRRHRFSERFLARYVHRRVGRFPHKALVRAAMLALDQLWRDVAQYAGKSRAQRALSEQAAFELVEAVLLHTQRAP